LPFFIDAYALVRAYLLEVVRHLMALWPRRVGTVDRQPPGVSRLMFIVVLAGVLPPLAVTVALILTAYNQEQARLSAAAIGRARALVAAVDRDIGATQVALATLASGKDSTPETSVLFQDRVRDALVTMEVESISITKLNGHIQLALSKEGTGTAPPCDDALQASVITLGRAVVSDLDQGAPLHRFAVAVPVLRDGRVRAVLHATRTGDQLVGLLLEQRLPPQWRAAVVDRNGRVVARSHDQSRFSGRLVTDDLLLKMQHSVEGDLRTVTLDGIAVSSFYSSSSLSGWSVVLGIPRAEFDDELYALLALVLCAAAVASALGLGFAYRYGTLIARAVEALVGPAGSLGTEAAVVIARLPLAEADAVGQALVRTQQKLTCMQAAMRESEQRLALAAEAAELGFWVRETAGDGIWASCRWRVLFGFDASEQITFDAVQARIDPRDRDIWTATLTGLSAALPSYDMQYRIAGTACWIASRGRAEFGPAGDLIKVRGVSLNITARKLAELALMAQQDELIHLARVSVLGQLSATLAHELGQPLTALLSNLQAGRRMLHTAAAGMLVDDALCDAEADAQRAAAIVYRWRQLAAPRVVPHKVLELGAVIAAALRVLRSELAARKVQVDCSAVLGPAHVLGDEVQLQQLVINLILNASDALATVTEPERTVCVQLYAGAHQTWELVVIDHGKGLLESEWEQVFTPFFSTKEHGMGLGLTICRTIALAHRGAIWASEGLARATRFHVSLPRQDNDG
jgi:signal transduction histidine kinase